MAHSSRIVILKGDPTADGQHPTYKLLQLPNPSTGQQQQYILTSSGLLEVNRVKHAATSWLVDDTFVSDGSAYLATPVNVVYVLLALLHTESEEAAGMFQEVESLLCSEEWPAAQQLLGLAQQELPCICDVKALEDCTYYKLNNNKVLAYLRVCAAQALEAFQAHSPGSITGLSNVDQQAYVIKFLREYMSQAWHDKLVSSYGFDPKAFSGNDAAVPQARPAAASPTETTAEKKQKVLDPKEVARKKAEESRAAAAAAKLKQHAAGTKKISQFFTAKKPKQ